MSIRPKKLYDEKPNNTCFWCGLFIPKETQERIRKNCEDRMVIFYGLKQCGWKCRSYHADWTTSWWIKKEKHEF